MEKVKVFVEMSEEGPYKFIRPHRVWHGPMYKGVIETELEYDEFELISASLCEDDEGCPGRSVRVPGIDKLVLTSDPSIFGTDDDRRAAGRMIFNKMKFGEWNLLGEF